MISKSFHRYLSIFLTLGLCACTGASSLNLSDSARSFGAAAENKPLFTRPDIPRYSFPKNRIHLDENIEFSTEKSPSVILTPMNAMGPEIEETPQEFMKRLQDRFDFKEIRARATPVLQSLTFQVKYSSRLGLPLEGHENRSLILAVDEWLGTPYKWGGCTKNGVDCSCFVRDVYRKVYGIELKRTSRAMYYEDLIPIGKRSLQEGDILFFKTRGNRISHVGIFLKDDKFAHASLSDGVTISDLNHPYYQKRFCAGGRVEGIRVSMKGSISR